MKGKAVPDFILILQQLKKIKPMQQYVSDLRPLTFKLLNYLTADQISQQTRQA